MSSVKLDHSPTLLRLSAKLYHYSADIAYKGYTGDARQRALNSLAEYEGFLATSRRIGRQRSLRVNLPHWKEATGMGKAVAASMAMWYTVPHAPYVFTLYFDNSFKEKGFDNTRDDLTKFLKPLGVRHYWFAFEITRKGWLHAHGAMNLGNFIDRAALGQALERTFASSKELRRAISGPKKRIVIDEMGLTSPVGATTQRSPETWAAYSTGDILLTERLLEWNRVYCISQPLIRPAETMYNWMRRPTPAVPLPAVDVPHTYPVYRPPDLQSPSRREANG